MNRITHSIQTRIRDNNSDHNKLPDDSIVFHIYMFYLSS